MSSENNAMQSYTRLTQEEQRLMDGVAVPVGARHRVQTKFMNSIHPKSKRFIGLSALVFSGAMAAIILLVTTAPHANTVIVSNNQTTVDGTVTTSSALMVNPYEIENFACEENCRNLVVTGNPTPLFVGENCIQCNEILLWANMNVEKDVITLMGEVTIQGEFVSLPDKILLLSDYPNWVGQAFPVSINGTDTILNVILRQTNEDNLIADVNCSSGCENIKVGVQRDSGINELLIDTCRPKSCNMFAIISAPIMDEINPPENGVWIEDDNWNGGYSVSVWRIPSLFAFNDDHGEEIARIDYSPEQTASGAPLRFDQVVDGHHFTFDLASTLPLAPL